MLIKQKYRRLFSPKRVRRPGPKGPTKELIDAVVEMKRRKRTWGCKRIAQQLTLAFGVDIDKDVVRRTPAIHFHPEAGSGGPSWLSFIGHAKDSLWSLDLFRCESAILNPVPGETNRSAHYSRQQPIWRTNSGSFRIISIDNVCTRAWEHD